MDKRAGGNSSGPFLLKKVVTHLSENTEQEKAGVVLTPGFIDVLGIDNGVRIFI